MVPIIRVKVLQNLIRGLGNLSADGRRQQDDAGKNNISFQEGEGIRNHYLLDTSLH